MSTPVPTSSPARDEGVVLDAVVVDAVVVGGGLAGLVAARTLARAGLRTLVLEARDAAGGAVRAHEVAGLRLDAGAESFATRGGTVVAFLADLGLGDAVVSPAALGSWVHLPSGDGPLPRTGLLGIPSQPWSRDVRRTLGTLGAARAAADRWLPARVGRSATSLGELVRRRMGARVVDRLVRPVVGGVHAADPDDLAVDAVAPGLTAALATHRSLAVAVATLRAAAPAGAAVLGLRGGLHTLVDALRTDLAAHGATVLLRSPVTRVEPVAASDGGGRPDVLVTHRGGTVRARRLVVACPQGLDALGALLPDLADVRLDDGADVRLVTLVLSSRGVGPGVAGASGAGARGSGAAGLDDAPRGTGVLVGRGATDVRAKALTHATAKWPWLAEQAGAGRHVVRLSYGRAPAGSGSGSTSRSASASGSDEGAGADLGDFDLVTQGLADASVLLGVPLDRTDLLGDAVVRWSQALPRPSAAHREATARVAAALASAADDDRAPRLAACGAWFAGNGLASVIPQAESAARALV
ncbi:protoporphyrinogen/coproporphyrinogen oxidase [Cellulomonas composti]|uniref:Protoporphyrinogen oxidase n=1 Tax=Cellulomonas composti TaxID=266130 RepID=A0A511JDJ1_9CELL|nr:FAD-dependent oxidoreductase [Cellulomonas composti]GEL96032.1 protoporphyrinogen oxidase [Cellulomonas composti]